MDVVEKLFEREDEKNDNKRSGKGRKKQPSPPPKRKTPSPRQRNCGISCLALIVLMMGAGVLLVIYGLQPADDAAIEAQAPTPDVPEVALTSYDGQLFKVSDFQGSIVVLNFWSAGCGACGAESFSLQAIHDGYRAKGVVVIGLNPVDDDTAARAFISQYQLTYLHAPDTAKNVSSHYNVQVIPQTLILNRDGSVAESLLVPVDYQRLKTLLDALLANG